MTRTCDSAGYWRVCRRTKLLGWRVTVSGQTFRILDEASQLLHTGPLSETEAFLAAQPRPPYKYSRTQPPAAWAPLIDAYMVTLVAAGQPENTTVKLRRQQLTKMSRDLAGNPAELTADTLVGWFGAQAWATETRRSYRATVRGFLRWAYRTKRIPDHLADELPKVREQRGAPRPTPDRVWREALLAATPRVALMLRLAAEAGLRRGEVSRIHSRDLLDGAGGPQLLVNGKGGKQRVVPISEDLADAIRTGVKITSNVEHAPHLESADSLRPNRTRVSNSETHRHDDGATVCPKHTVDDGWLFPNGRGGHITPEWVGEVCAAVLPDGWTLHTLRHRYASRAYRGTRNLRAVQVLLGHESIATTQRYTAVDDGELRAAMTAAIDDARLANQPNPNQARVPDLR